MKKKVILINMVMALILLCFTNTNAATINNLSATINQSTKMVTVSGTIDTGANKQITIVIIGPNGEIEYLNEKQSDNSSAFEFSYIMENSIKGEYIVKVGGEDVDQPKQTTFTYSGESSSGYSGGYGSGGTGGNLVSPSGAITSNQDDQLEETDEESEPSIEENLDTSLESDISGEVIFTKEQEDNMIKEIKKLSENRDLSKELKFVIDVDNGQNLEKSSVTIPTSVVKQAKKSQIDQFEINTPVADFNIPTDVIYNSSADSIRIDSKKVNKNELTSVQRGIVGDEEVYSFNMSLISNGKEKNINNFSKDIEITIPYTLKNGQDPNKITVFFMNENGEIENMQGIFNSQNNTVSFKTNHFSNFFVKENNITFTDLEEYAWAKRYIEVLASKGIISGKENGTFAPEQNITRAEFVKLCVGLLRVKSNNPNINFLDVNKDDWYYDSVAVAYQAGLIQGHSSEIFAPNDYITRQDMTVILIRVLEKAEGNMENVNSNLVFSDESQISSYAKKSVAKAENFGLIKGYEDNTFRPYKNASRAEAATMIYRLYNLIN